MELNIQVILYATISLLLTVVRAQNYATCQGSESCIPLEKCPVLSKRVLESSNRSFSEITYLRSKQCGYTYPDVMVCCELEPMSRSATDELGIIADIGATTTVSSGRGAILPNPPECGPVFAHRVVGGRTTSIYEFPWMAILEYTNANNKKVFLCDGSLINNRYLLTAAHCVVVSGMTLTSVRLGEWDKTMDPDCEINLRGLRNCAKLHPINVAIEKTVVHENYESFSSTPHFDIALLRLVREVEYTDLVRPICLPPRSLQNELFVGFKMDVAGWGFTEKNKSSDVKLKAELGIWSLNDCRSTYALYNATLIDSQMCAGGESGLDACSGDSGGPLMTIVDNIQILAGIVSYGPTACGTNGLPGVYTRVGHFLDWISQRLKP